MLFPSLNGIYTPMLAPNWIAAPTAIVTPATACEIVTAVDVMDRTVVPGSIPLPLTGVPIATSAVDANVRTLVPGDTAAVAMSITASDAHVETAVFTWAAVGFESSPALMYLYTMNGSSIVQNHAAIGVEKKAASLKQVRVEGVCKTVLPPQALWQLEYLGSHY